MWFNLASKISSVKWSDEDQSQIQEELRGLEPKLQQQFFEYCKKWKLAPWAYVQLLNYNFLDILTEDVKEQFKSAHSKVKDQNTSRNNVAKNVLKAFNENDIQAAVLKGNYFISSVYNEVGYKRMNDFDILIHKNDWDRIQDIYLEKNFIPLGFGWSGEKEKPAKFSHVGMAFISPDYHCIMGSQWGLKSATTKFKTDIDSIWRDVVEFEFEGVKVNALSPEHNLLHLVLHMGIYKCGIRDCMDVYNVVISNEIDWDKLYRILEKSNALDKAYYTFSMSNLCVNVIPDEFINKLKERSKGYIKRRTVKRLKVHEQSGDFQNSYIDYFQDIEKDVIYFNLFPHFHKKAKYLFKIVGKIYFPKSKVSLKLDDHFHQPTFWHKLKGSIKAPFHCFALIAQEIGWKFTFLLFMKLFIDLIVSIKNYVIKKESYFDYLKKKGINPKEIVQAVEGIQ
ncbi:nucleotidyltransferase family protein [Paracrocinitomix mangrovi]|uniref:nucleotidyltransferase family protein n=1 Tax=Paracrocinitomix mangrovi TaxID=2862509 RepID=UPI001C8E1291|nr:nucleotidyltransferase family protein [Paracrocinitomix mangrovi]UKN00246.1 nucleotidyltransferase family protein [Paracrocinitomix mangrovi]